MQKILLTIIAVLAVLFALQNGTPVTLTLAIWQVETMVAVVVLGALAIGLALGALTMLPAWWRARGKARSARREAHAAAHPAPPLPPPADEADSRPKGID